jgi:hypothetical protein
VAALEPRVEPRVHEHGGSLITLWTHYEPATPREVSPADHTPALADADRELLGGTLRSLGRVVGERGGAEQLLHGEPHPGNVLTTKDGLLFIDLETCCRGPVEFDLAHAPEGVSDHYPGVDHDLLRDCRILVLAMITTWRRAEVDRHGLDVDG